MKPIAIAMFTTLASPALSQGACPAEIPFPDPCIVGNWIGDNTAVIRIQAAIDSMPLPDAERTVIMGMSPVLGMTVFDDGLYATLPFHTDMEVITVTEEDTLTVDMNLAIGTQVGFIWGDGTNLHFCTTGESFVALQVDAESTLGGSSSTMITPGGMGGFTPVITYQCSGNSWTYQVQLPPPIGTVDYNLERFSDARFPEEFRALLDDRFGIE